MVAAPLDGTVTKVDKLPVGQYLNAATPAFSLVANKVWIEANFKETDLTHMRAGPEGDGRYRHLSRPSPSPARVQSIGAGTGSEFSVLPPQNATGNWVKVVQRVPVRLACDDLDPDRPLRAGMSANVEVDTHYRHPLLVKLDQPASDRDHRPGSSRSERDECAPTQLGGCGKAAHRGLVTVCVMLATIMQALDTSIANVALPHMQGSLSATQDQIAWVLTSYIVAAAIATPLTGWLAGRYGRKRLFLVRHHRLHLRLAAVRHRPEPDGDRALPPAARRVRRGAGAGVAGDAARRLSARAPRRRDGDLGRRHRRRADPGSDARRLAHRHL